MMSKEDDVMEDNKVYESSIKLKSNAHDEINEILENESFTL